MKNGKKGKKNKIKRSTTKIIMLFLFINCTIIELFTGWVTIQSLKIAMVNGLSPDFTPLVTLIGAIVGEVIGFAIYAMKSAKENSRGGITYLQAEQEFNNQINPLDEEGEC